MPRKIRTSPTLLFLQLFVLIILSDFLTILFLSFEDFSPSIFSFSREITILLFFSVVKIVVAIWIFLKWLFDFYTVQSGILIHCQGILFRTTREFLLPEIENITLYRGFWGGICDFGRVSIRFANEYFTFRRIPDPEHFVELLHAHK